MTDKLSTDRLELCDLPGSWCSADNITPRPDELSRLSIKDHQTTQFLRFHAARWWLFPNKVFFLPFRRPESFDRNIAVSSSMVPALIDSEKIALDLFLRSCLLFRGGRIR